MFFLSYQKYIFNNRAWILKTDGWLISAFRAPINVHLILSFNFYYMI